MNGQKFTSVLEGISKGLDSIRKEGDQVDITVDYQTGELTVQGHINGTHFKVQEVLTEDSDVEEIILSVEYKILFALSDGDDCYFADRFKD